jgi:hypothetical protein
MQKLIIGLCLFFSGICSPLSAHEAVEGQIWFLAGPSLNQTLFNPPSESTSKSVLLGGQSFFIQGDLNDKSSLELYFSHANKQFFLKTDAGVLAEQTQLLHIAMGYRHWISNYLSTALLFYSSYSMGTPTKVHQDQSLVGSQLVTSAQDITEYGFDFSVQYEIWSEQSSTVFLDTRYSASLTSKADEVANHASFIIGYKWLIQTKNGLLD